MNSWKGAEHIFQTRFVYSKKLIKKKFFFNLFMAVLGLRFCARAFSSCGKRGPLFIAVRGPLTIAASLVVEHRLQTRRLSNCGSRAQPLLGMWNLPRPGLEPVSPALAGGLSTTAPPGKPLKSSFLTHQTTLLSLSKLQLEMLSHNYEITQQSEIDVRNCHMRSIFANYIDCFCTYYALCLLSHVKF